MGEKFKINKVFRVTAGDGWGGASRTVAASTGQLPPGTYSVAMHPEETPRRADVRTKVVAIVLIVCLVATAAPVLISALL